MSDEEELAFRTTSQSAPNAPLLDETRLPIASVRWFMHGAPGCVRMSGGALGHSSPSGAHAPQLNNMSTGTTVTPCSRSSRRAA